MKPDFVGLGAQKCGTTWIYRALVEHPGIAVGRGEHEKDIRFFSHYFDRGYEWYERHFAEVTTDGPVGEIATSYFCHPEAPARLREYHEELKLIVCLRNPIDRAFSHHLHELRLGRISGANRNFQNALENNPTYVSQGFYFRHLNRWLEIFPRRQLLVLLFDDLQKNPESFVSSLYEFLGANAEFQPSILHNRVNASETRRFPGFRSNARSLRALAKRLGLSFLTSRSAGPTSASSTALHDETPVAEMEPQLRADLRLEFQSDIEALSRMLDRDLSDWV